MFHVMRLYPQHPATQCDCWDQVSRGANNERLVQQKMKPHIAVPLLLLSANNISQTLQTSTIKLFNQTYRKNLQKI